MNNETLFILHSCLISIMTLISAILGKSALITAIALQCILANLLVVKQISLFGYAATAADPFAIGAIMGLNILQEYYGKESSRRAIGISFIMLVFYAIITQIHLWYLPHIDDCMHTHFEAIFATTPRIVTASISVFLIVQLLDYMLYGFLKRICQDHFVVVRNFFSLVTCQFIDTVLFTFLGLWPLMTHPWQIISISYSVKLLAVIIAIPSIMLIHYVSKKFKIF